MDPAGSTFLLGGTESRVPNEQRQGGLAMSDTVQEPRIARETGAARRVVELIEPVVESLGYRIVRIRLTGDAGATLQIMADKKDGHFGIDDCEAISRAISPVLDVEDPIASKYLLEVSSPGIARPLVRPSDFEHWSGHEAKIEMAELIAGRRRFRGVLEGYTDGEVRIFIDGEEGGERVLVGLPFDTISDARLVMTDALVAAATRKQED